MIPDMIRISLAHYTTHLRAAGRSPGTISLRVRHAKRMLTYVGKPPAMVALGDIEEWIAGHDWAASTHRSVVASMRLYFGWLGTDTADGLESPPEPRPCPKPTPPDVLGHALAHSSGKLHLLVRLAACSGMRRAELASVHSDQVERTRDGGLFSTRRVVAIQHGEPIFHMECGFHAPEPGYSHQSALPAGVPEWLSPLTAIIPGQLLAKALAHSSAALTTSLPLASSSGST